MPQSSLRDKAIKALTELANRPEESISLPEVERLLRPLVRSRKGSAESIRLLDEVLQQHRGSSPSP